MAEYTPLFDLPVLIRSGGDLASGAAYRLVRAGFPVIIAELEKPLLVRPTVSYGAAIFHGQVVVEGITAKRVALTSPPAPLSVDGEGESVEQRSVPDNLSTWQNTQALWADPSSPLAERRLGGEAIPVVIDPDGQLLARLRPPIVVDARMAKVNLGTTIHDAPLVIGLGPGFTAGADCHAVIETNRGHWLGRVIWEGGAEPDTGVPGKVSGREAERVLRAPRDGYVTGGAPIGELVHEGDSVAWMNDQPIRAPFDGILRGLIHESVYVTAGLKIGDLDPRAQRDHCFTISDKALAVGGGVVEATLSAPQIRRLIQSQR